MAGMSLKEQGIDLVQPAPPKFSVKESVFPFVKFPGVDPILGPEMKSTGEVMGIGDSFEEAFAKALRGASITLPQPKGAAEPLTAFVSVRDVDKEGAVQLCKDMIEAGFVLCGTSGTAKFMQAAGVECAVVKKVTEGRPHIVDMLKNHEVSFVVNTTEGKRAIEESRTVRSAALSSGTAYFTTLAGGFAAVGALEHLDNVEVTRLQDVHA